MKRKFQHIAYLLMVAAVITSCGEKKQTSEFPDWAWADFQRPEGINPIVSPDTTTVFYCPMRQDSVAWESSDTFNPAATIYDGKVVVLYRAEDNSAVGIGSRTSRLGYAYSDDGLHFNRMTVPVFYPADDNQKELEWPGGCEDPRVAVTDDGLYVMLYTQWNRKQARLAVATSTDLINWEPMLDKKGDFLKVITPREGKFDSDLTECGPPAIMTDKGILLLYNGKNKSGAEGDTLYTANSYCAGQALFDAKDPTKLIDRLDKPFYIPESDFEKSGQYPAGTVFIEGLVFHNQKWYLYYGCADSRVAVAVYDPFKK